MPTEAINIQASQMLGAQQLGGASPLSVNALVDDVGALRSRPGISAWDTFPTAIPHESPVIGMIPFGEFLVYVTEDRQLHAVSETTGYQALSSSTDTTTLLAGAATPSMVAMRNIVVACGSGAPQQWDGAAALSSRLGGSPPDMSHVIGIATRLVGSVAGESGTFQWSGLGDAALETWDALNYAEAEAKPDVIVSMVDTTNEIFMLGANTLQVFSPDPSVGFAAGRTLNIGLLAENSVVRTDDSIAFLDSLRRFVVTDGRAFQNVGTQLAGEIETMATVDDCLGMRLTVGAWDGVVWFMPTMGRAFVWSRDKNRWSEWRGWSSGDWAATNITSSVQWPELGLSLVGLETGQIAKLDDDAVTDLGDPIEIELISGFVDHGSGEIKHSSALRLVTNGPSTSTISVSWRDGANDAFCRPVRVAMNQINELRSLGAYRKRQYKLRWTAAANAAVVAMEEDFEFSQRKAAA